MGRVDFYHDPAALAANSIVPSVTVAVRDGAGRILLVHKIDNDYWALPAELWTWANRPLRPRCA